jgi:hypothetical protein
VSRGAQKNFSVFADYIAKAWAAAPEDFNEDYFRTVVGRVILFRGLERLVSAQPWYSGGYRANVVAYAMAKLSRMISEQAPDRVLDAKAIWSAGSISLALSEQLASVARAMHDVITNPPVGVQNVTEWSKREQCWQKAGEVVLTLKPAFAAELISRSSRKVEAKTARDLQRLDDGISAQNAVVALGQDYWKGVRQWATDAGYLSYPDEKLLRMAAEYVPNIPDDRQSKKILELKRRYELEGMPPPDVDV